MAPNGKFTTLKQEFQSILTSFKQLLQKNSNGNKVKRCVFAGVVIHKVYQNCKVDTHERISSATDKDFIAQRT